MSETGVLERSLGSHDGFFDLSEGQILLFLRDDPMRADLVPQLVDLRLALPGALQEARGVAFLSGVGLGLNETHLLESL